MRIGEHPKAVRVCVHLNTLTPLNEISHMSDSVQETKDVDAFNDSHAQKTFILETTLKNKNKRTTILILS